MIMDKDIKKDETQQMSNAVNILKTAILQSQARAAKAVNHEQLLCIMALAAIYQTTPVIRIGVAVF